MAEALATLGLTGLRNLCGVLILAGVESKPRYLVQTLLTRAKMAERLAALSQRDDIEDYFTAGMLSVLPPLLDLPIDEALRGLRINASVRAALLDRQGPLAEVIDCVLSYERGEWDRLHCLSLNATQIRRAYLHAITWSNDIYRDLLH
jgi:EAL and modified HD-GYP domain-containing signal transduction protein